MSNVLIYLEEFMGKQTLCLKTSFQKIYFLLRILKIQKSLYFMGKFILKPSYLYFYNQVLISSFIIVHFFLSFIQKSYVILLDYS